MPISPKDKKLIYVIILFIISFILFSLLLMKIYEFSRYYKECEDDFRVIEECGCFPYEGNYSYFLRDNPNQKEMYELNRQVYNSLNDK